MAANPGLARMLDGNPRLKQLLTSPDAIQGMLSGAPLQWCASRLKSRICMQPAPQDCAMTLPASHRSCFECRAALRDHTSRQQMFASNLLAKADAHLRNVTKLDIRSKHSFSHCNQVT